MIKIPSSIHWKKIIRIIRSPIIFLLLCCIHLLLCLLALLHRRTSWWWLTRHLICVAHIPTKVAITTSILLLLHRFIHSISLSRIWSVITGPWKMLLLIVIESLGLLLLILLLLHVAHFRVVFIVLLLLLWLESHLLLVSHIIHSLKFLQLHAIMVVFIAKLLWYCY